MPILIKVVSFRLTVESRTGSSYNLRSEFNVLRVVEAFHVEEPHPYLLSVLYIRPWQM